MNFPVIPDEDGEIHRMFGMIPPEAPLGEATIFKRPFSSLVIVDEALVVKAQTIYPATLGHNFFEAIRCLEALQRVDLWQHTAPGSASTSARACS